MRRSLGILALMAVVAFGLAGGPVGGQGEAERIAADAEAPVAAAAQEHQEGGHGSAVAPVLAGLVIILVGAKLGGELAERFHQPAVLGELIVGVLLGNLVLFGFHGFEFLRHDPGIAILAELGVILLLFEVGLESNVREMLSVGPSSLLVAILGVVAPVLLGFGASAWLLPEEELLTHLFIGATLAATSVGITARVLTDLGKVTSRESRIILGAAVIDDVLGLVLLAVCTGMIQAANTGGELAALDIFWIIAKAAIFLVGAIVIGAWLSPRVFRLASLLRIKGMLLTVALGICFLLAWVAHAMGLAAIVGAFAAGMILDEVHYSTFIERGDHRLEELLHPVSLFLVPVFFVLMGVKVDLSTFGDVEVLGLAAVITLCAIIGKMLCWFGIVERGLDRLSVAVGMVPRGEVGLIFAGIGAGLILHGHRVVSGGIFSAVVIMVIVTTLITPPLLKVTLDRGDRVKAARGAGTAPESPPSPTPP
ncbi:MAG: cation:proton antiporter [Thermoanaerobaculia bacterium]